MKYKEYAPTGFDTRGAFLSDYGRLDDLTMEGLENESNS